MPTSERAGRIPVNGCISMGEDVALRTPILQLHSSTDS